MSEASLVDFGLEDPSVLETAVRLAPPLFGALRLATQLSDASYPLDSMDKIKLAFASVADNGRYEQPGFLITGTGLDNGFVSELLPVTDRIDLIRKIFLALNIGHTKIMQASLQRALARRPLHASHPLPEVLT